MTDLDLSKKVSRLTAAVWVLGVLISTHLAYDLYANHSSVTPVTPFAVSNDAPIRDPWDGFSIEQKIEQSSAVMVVDHVSDGRRLKAIVKTIVKRSPDTKIFYQLGEEVPNMSRDARSSTNWGDGMLVLLQGSPATFKESYSINDGRISGLGDMPVADVLQLARAP